MAKVRKFAHNIKKSLNIAVVNRSTTRCLRVFVCTVCTMLSKAQYVIPLNKL